MTDLLHVARPTPLQAAAAARHKQWFRPAPKPVVVAVPIIDTSPCALVVEVKAAPKLVQSLNDWAFGPVILSDGDAFGPIIAATKLRPGVINIATAAAKHFGLTRSEMLGKCRASKLAGSRHIAMFLAQTLTLRSLPEIGRMLGGRDHTTILHGVRKIQARILSGNSETIGHIEAIHADLALRFNVDVAGWES